MTLSHTGPLATSCVHRRGRCGVVALTSGEASMEELFLSGEIALPASIPDLHATRLELARLGADTPPTCTHLPDPWSTHLHRIPGTLPGTLVLLPPLAGDVATWTPLLAEIRRRPHPEILLLDPPGWGETGYLPVPAATQYPRWAREVVSALLAARPGPHTIVGHSFGGRLALEALPALDPDTRLVLLTPALPELMNTRLRAPLAALAGVVALLARLPEALRHPLLTALIHTFTARPARRHHPAATQAALGVARALGTSPLTELTAWLWEDALSLPLPAGTPVILGRRDWLLRRDAARVARRAGASVHEFATGHLPTLEDPERTAACILEVCAPASARRVLSRPDVPTPRASEPARPRV